MNVMFEDTKSCVFRYCCGSGCSSVVLGLTAPSGSSLQDVPWPSGLGHGHLHGAQGSAAPSQHQHQQCVQVHSGPLSSRVSAAVLASLGMGSVLLTPVWGRGPGSLGWWSGFLAVARGSRQLAARLRLGAVNEPAQADCCAYIKTTVVETSLSKGSSRDLPSRL